MKYIFPYFINCILGEVLPVTKIWNLEASKPISNQFYKKLGARIVVMSFQNLASYSYQFLNERFENKLVGLQLLEP